MKNYLRILFISSLIFTSGCASLAYRSYSCGKNFPPSRVVGMISQVGDCALFRDLHYENGEFYDDYKSSIDFAVKTYKISDKYVDVTLTSFALNFNCSEKSDKIFADKLFANKDEIFGANFDKSPRRVTLNILEMIKNDDVLSKVCML